MASVVVVGGGVGGLAAAVRLQAGGHGVTVLERHGVVGGKLGVRRRDGFSFDTGPSLVTLPAVIDELFRVAGSSLAEEMDLVRLDPQFRYRWPDGTTWDVADPVMGRSESVPPGGNPDAVDEFLRIGGQMWDVSERTFFAGPMTGLGSLLRRMRSPRDLTTIRPLQTLQAFATEQLADSHLVQWAGRYATYSGSSPWRAPATLCCIAAIEARYGCWYPRGGLAVIGESLARLAADLGVEVRVDSEVARITTASSGAVSGVELADGSRLAAEIVVANVDAEHLYSTLQPDARALRRVRRAPRSTSGLAILVGVRGTTEHLAHHNIWFSSDSRREFGQLAAGEPADEPTVYACVSSVTDASQAPAGDENWFVLVNAPPDPDRVPAAYAEVVLDRLAACGVDLRPRAAFTEVITPADLEHRFRNPGGAIYGTSSDGRRAAFLRPANRGARRGLYLVGGSSHPGGGLPLVMISARIVADMIGADGW